MKRNFNIFQDWSTNKGYFKGQLVLLLFRSATLVKSNIILTVLFCWYLLFYRFFVEWVLGVELSWNLTAGKGLQLFHGQALIVNGNTIIGENCILRHSTTIGNKGETEFSRLDSPIIGNNVNIGANVCILGHITIGDNVKIGAGSIITKDIPSNCIVVGNPARIIKNN
ncbi:serine acetyltransferase [Mucilaginibacter gilvus]|uniref:Serine acetyltransferase n=1 Tax=Mucilaginibacter gilvus TaxID=2305909 RepID=A0A444MJ42_9SPHI|nr:DapH/DapD/GlmU-related protein [Mucilaginibacter gilvus]RWY48107.1 serine acetyltransferase [Mucilaginibacter gilvus]